MHSEHFLKRSLMPVAAEDLFAWHARDGAFERLRPPWQDVRVRTRSGPLATGSRVTLSVPLLGPVCVPWVAEHRDVVPGRGFIDVQLRGPFARWHHEHRFEPASAATSWLEDRIEFALPGGFVGRILGGARVRRDLERLFEFRHARTRGDLAAHRAAAHAGLLDVCIDGQPAALVAELAGFLSTGGHQVRAASWAGDHGIPSAAARAIVHCAGPNGAGDGSALVASLPFRLRGDLGTPGVESDTRAGVTTTPGTIVVVHGWTTNPAGSAWDAFRADCVRRHVRFANLRSAPLLRSSRQRGPWVAPDDLLGAVLHVLVTPGLEGAVDVCAPGSDTGPRPLEATGFVFRNPRREEALRSIRGA